MSAAGYIASMPRDQQDRAGKIRMFPSGLYVDPFDLKLGDIQIEDIAHHLAIINRYTGGSPFPVSVAYHSVRVARASVDMTAVRGLCTDDQIHALERRLAHLLHDAAEAYLNDLSSPVKKKPGMEAYLAAHRRAEDVIFRCFGLDPDLINSTKELDDGDFRREVRSFYEPHLLQPAERVEELTWRQAEAMFVAEFHSIWNRLQQLGVRQFEERADDVRT